jgi:uncharacterized protein YbjT (DUF2867 family)
MMRLLLLGATGRTGWLIMEKALAGQHQVTAIVRDPSKLRGMNVTIIKGTPYDPDTVKAAIKDCQAVICTLNISRTTDSPWARLRAPKDLISRSIQNALQAMAVNGSKRIISLSALGAGESKKKMPFIFKVFIASSNLRYAYRDHTRQEALLAKSDSNWTVIRLPVLTEEPGEFEILVNKNDGVKLNRDINREAVARFILSILDDAQYYRKIVAISKK